MDLKDKNLSLQFYNYLCDIIGSEEVVRTRREIFTVMDIVDKTDYLTFISTGSKAEGLNLKGSDYDRMGLHNFIRVYESLDGDQSISDEMPLIMDTNNTKPGFTKLKLVDKSYLDSDILSAWCETEGEETFISSKRVLERNLPDEMVIHGPCVSTVDGEYDQAFCLKCEEWITPAQQWIHRSRTAWPDCTLVTSAIQHGVLFVPIGCKNSPHEYLQWRVSFSVTEKLLIHSLSHTQLLCYALLKIILKDIIKPRHRDLLCSYFLKTIMFWLSEEISPSQWKPECIHVCFLDCVRRLIYCVEYKTCLHYFIPENNLFEDRFTGIDHKPLLDTLRFIYGSPWTYVFYSETFMNYRLQSVNSHSMALSASALSCFAYIRVIDDSNSTYSFYRKFKHFGNGHNSVLRKDIFAYMICLCARKSIQISDFADKNKSWYKQYKRTFGHFKISLQSDSVSSWLLLASLFYKCKRFQECLDIIDYCLLSCTPDMIYLHSDNSFVEQTVFKQNEQKWGLLNAFKYLMIEHVSFRYPFSLLPNELKSLITRNSLHFPPIVYSYLLQFLCCHHLEDYRGKQNALHDFERTIRERYFIFSIGGISAIVNTSIDIVNTLL